MKTEKTKRVAIIGAGMAGITTAHILNENGFSLTVFEKSRGIGGRLATRREQNGFRFDHGAQFITARAGAFKAFTAEAVSQKTLKSWKPGERTDWFVGTPSMNAFLKPHSEHLDIRLESTVTEIKRHYNKWQLSLEDASQEEPFDLVISTIPAPQAKALIPSEVGLTEILRHVGIMPCWTLMVAFETSFEPGFEAQRFLDNDIAWLSHDGSRPDRTTQNCWTVHASPAWSEEHLEADPAEVVNALIEKLEALTAASLPKIAHKKAHRWRYAQTDTPLGQPYLSNSDQTLFIGGDWCLGARVECAYESGSAIAQAVLKAAG